MAEPEEVQSSAPTEEAIVREAARGLREQMMQEGNFYIHPTGKDRNWQRGWLDQSPASTGIYPYYVGSREDEQFQQGVDRAMSGEPHLSPRLVNRSNETKPLQTSFPHNNLAQEYLAAARKMPELAFAPKEIRHDAAIERHNISEPLQAAILKGDFGEGLKDTLLNIGYYAKNPTHLITSPLQVREESIRAKRLGYHNAAHGFAIHENPFQPAVDPHLHQNWEAGHRMYIGESTMDTEEAIHQLQHLGCSESEIAEALEAMIGQRPAAFKGVMPRPNSAPPMKGSHPSIVPISVNASGVITYHPPNETLQSAKYLTTHEANAKLGGFAKAADVARYNTPAKAAEVQKAALQTAASFKRPTPQRSATLAKRVGEGLFREGLSTSELEKERHKKSLRMGGQESLESFLEGWFGKGKVSDAELQQAIHTIKQGRITTISPVAGTRPKNGLRELPKGEGLSFLGRKGFEAGHGHALGVEQGVKDIVNRHKGKLALAALSAPLVAGGAIAGGTALGNSISGKGENSEEDLYSQSGGNPHEAARISNMVDKLHDPKSNLSMRMAAHAAQQGRKVMGTPLVQPMKRMHEAHAMDLANSQLDKVPLEGEIQDKDSVESEGTDREQIAMARGVSEDPESNLPQEDDYYTLFNNLVMDLRKEGQGECSAKMMAAEYLKNQGMEHPAITEGLKGAIGGATLGTVVGGPVGGVVGGLAGHALGDMVSPDKKEDQQSLQEGDFYVPNETKQVYHGIDYSQEPKVKKLQAMPFSPREYMRGYMGIPSTHAPEGKLYDPQNDEVYATGASARAFADEPPPSEEDIANQQEFVRKLTDHLGIEWGPNPYPPVDIENPLVGYVAKRNADVKRQQESLQEVIQKEGDTYSVRSEHGKNLGSGYKTKAAAAKRLGQVEYFKHAKESQEGVGSSILNAGSEFAKDVGKALRDESVAIAAQTLMNAAAQEVGSRVGDAIADPGVKHDPNPGSEYADDDYADDDYDDAYYEAMQEAMDTEEELRNLLDKRLHTGEVQEIGFETTPGGAAYSHPGSPNTPSSGFWQNMGNKAKEHLHTFGQHVKANKGYYIAPAVGTLAAAGVIAAGKIHDAALRREREEALARGYRPQRALLPPITYRGEGLPQPQQQPQRRPGPGRPRNDDPRSKNYQGAGRDSDFPSLFNYLPTKPEGEPTYLRMEAVKEGCCCEEAEKQYLEAMGSMSLQEKLGLIEANSLLEFDDPLEKAGKWLNNDPTGIATNIATSFDPTQVSGAVAGGLGAYSDVKDAGRSLVKGDIGGTAKNLGSAALNVAGGIPVVGPAAKAVGLIGKAGKVASGVKNAANVARVGQAFGSIANSNPNMQDSLQETTMARQNVSEVDWSKLGGTLVGGTKKVGSLIGTGAQKVGQAATGAVKFGGQTLNRVGNVAGQNAVGRGIHHIGGAIVQHAAPIAGTTAALGAGYGLGKIRGRDQEQHESLQEDDMDMPTEEKGQITLDPDVAFEKLVEMGIGEDEAHHIVMALLGDEEPHAEEPMEPQGPMGDEAPMEAVGNMGEASVSPAESQHYTSGGVGRHPHPSGRPNAAPETRPNIFRRAAQGAEQFARHPIQSIQYNPKKAMAAAAGLGAAGTAAALALHHQGKNQEPATPEEEARISNFLKTGRMPASEGLYEGIMTMSVPSSSSSNFLESNQMPMELREACDHLRANWMAGYGH